MNYFIQWIITIACPSVILITLLSPLHRSTKKKHHMMRFHAALGVDFKGWTHTKMERENNMKEFKSLEEDMPKWVSPVADVSLVFFVCVFVWQENLIKICSTMVGK